MNGLREVRDAIRLEMEAGRDPVGDHFDAVAREALALLAIIVAVAAIGAGGIIVL